MLKHKITSLFKLALLCFVLLFIISCDTVTVRNNQSNDTSTINNNATNTTLSKSSTESSINKNTEQNKLQAEIQNNDQQINGYLYENKKLGFSIVIPDIWKNKYTIKENDKYVSFCHQFNTNANINRPEIFAIAVEEESKWNQTKIPDGTPIEKLGIRNALVYVISWKASAPYAGGFEGIQKASDEFYEMSNQIDSITSTFKFID